MIKVGITGGIGSGKTTVCRIFEVLGVPVYNADERAKVLVQSDRQIIQAVKNLLGASVYDEHNKLDRKKVAGIIFTFPELLDKYNGIIHPAVMEDAAHWLSRHQNFDYTLIEAALLFETGMHKSLDIVITVSAPERLKIERTVKRDHISEAEVLARMENQWDEKDRIKLSDYIIYNDGNTPLIRQVLRIHRELIQLVKK